MISKTIFRAYDIRGTYPDQLNRTTAELIGKAFGTYLISETGNLNPKVAVGQDCRIHSQELFEGFTSGLLSTGCRITDLGITPSPYVYFSVTDGNFDGGCNITASHNSKEFNGFKLMTESAHPVFGGQLQKLHKIVEAKAFKEGVGIIGTDDFTGAYEQKLRSIFPFSKALKVAVDTGNGVAGKLYPKILRALGHEVLELYTDLDGTFPNHEADPVIENNLDDLKKMVVKENADLGLGFDGDGDRIGLITEKGEFILADKLLMLLTKDVLTRHPGGALVFTVANSQALFDLAKSWGGKPVMCKVGHSFVEDTMSEHRAILGGEQSGHFFLPENYYPYDDALVAVCRVLKIASESEKPVSQLFSEFPKTHSFPENRPYCDDEKKFDVLQKIVDHFKPHYACSTLDGIRLNFGEGGWCGMRVSNTSPRISIIMEAGSSEKLLAIQEVVMNHLKSYPEIDWTR